MKNNNRRIFGTDGVRGKANIEPVTAETALKLGWAAGYVFKKRNLQPRGYGKHKIVLGKDTRLSGYMLESAISSGILSMGVDVLFIGPLPTPGVAYVTRSLRADAGIVITASHNPYDDNGIKFFSDDGYKLDDRIEDEIEGLVFSGQIEKIRPSAEDIGKAVRIDDALGRYIEYAKTSFPKGMTLEGMRIVVDCAHGAAYKSTPCVLRELGAEVFTYGVNPDGMNINRDCGSMFPDNVCRKVWEHGADLGIAHDGDADRVLFCDENGSLIDGDDVMAIAGIDMLRNGALTNNTLVTTIMSNAGLDVALGKAGGKTVRTAVGDKYVIDEMLRNDYNFGGEQSGHLIFRDHSTTGDGLVSALQILRIMKSSGKTLSELCKCWTRFPQKVYNVRVRDKVPFEKLDGVMDAVAQAEAKVGKDGGRVLLRYSGTEPKARLLIEGRDIGALEQWGRTISEAIRKRIGE
ncbi:MAG: phosphoglucosamine mutase [Verrucomicrobia bacterium]|nr:phosphoglucosamine mutase [Verrucomicrobiota bacterium]MCF7708682.1 phosphoglucosamine mutase [Verrucomicrobiota bacterium]